MNKNLQASRMKLSPKCSSWEGSPSSGRVKFDRHICTLAPACIKLLSRDAKLIFISGKYCLGFIESFLESKVSKHHRPCHSIDYASQ